MLTADMREQFTFLGNEPLQTCQRRGAVDETQRRRRLLGESDNPLLKSPGDLPRGTIVTPCRDPAQTSPIEAMHIYRERC